MSATTLGLVAAAWGVVMALVPAGANPPDDPPRIVP